MKPPPRPDEPFHGHRIDRPDLDVLRLPLLPHGPSLFLMADGRRPISCLLPDEPVPRRRSDRRIRSTEQRQRPIDVGGEHQRSRALQKGEGAALTPNSSNAWRRACSEGERSSLISAGRQTTSAPKAWLTWAISVVGRDNDPSTELAARALSIVHAMRGLPQSGRTFLAGEAPGSSRPG